MARWEEVEAAVPELAAEVRARLDAHAHKVLATVRRDGSPRLSGTETSFADGDLWFGGMWEARKAFDLRRDPRFALHSGSDDPPAWKGDAKVSGRVEEVTDPARVEAVMAASAGEKPPAPFHLFRADVADVVVVRLGEPADHLVIERWAEGRGLSRVERR